MQQVRAKVARLSTCENGGYTRVELIVEGLHPDLWEMLGKHARVAFNWMHQSPIPNLDDPAKPTLRDALFDEITRYLMLEEGQINAACTTLSSLEAVNDRAFFPKFADVTVTNNLFEVAREYAPASNGSMPEYTSKSPDKQHLANGDTAHVTIKGRPYDACRLYGMPRVDRPDQGKLTKQQMDEICDQSSMLSGLSEAQRTQWFMSLIEPAEAAEPPATAEPASVSRPTAEVVESCDGRKSDARGPESPSSFLLRTAASGNVLMTGGTVDRLIENVADQSDRGPRASAPEEPDTPQGTVAEQTRKARWSLLHG